MTTVSRIIQSSSRVAVIVACVAVIAHLAYARLGSRGGTERYVSGDMMEALPGTSFAAVPTTVVLYIGTNCHYCTSSMPFYRALMALDAVRQGDVQVIFVGNEPVDVLRAYLSMNDIPEHRVVYVDAAASKLYGTPTLLLVNGEGRVQRVWVGQQPPSTEGEVVSILRAATRRQGRAGARG